MRLLIIEDESKTITYLRKGFLENGFVVDHALNGQDGLFLATTGNYDVVIEVVEPELEIDGRCLTRRFLYLTGPFYLFFDPTDRFEGQGVLRVTVTDRNGQVLQEEAFKSQRVTKDSMFATSSDRTNAAAAVLRDGPVDDVAGEHAGVALDLDEEQTLPRKEEQIDLVEPTRRRVVELVEFPRLVWIGV